MLMIALSGAAPSVDQRAVWSSPGFAAYTHQKWGRERDAPKQIYSISQGRDGFLWLATGEGVYRFDGIRFERIPAPEAPNQGAPSAVLVTRNGDVWVSFSGSHRFAIYRGGRISMLPVSPVTHRVSSMREGPDGSVWVLSDAEDDPLFRLKDGRWTNYGRAQGIPSGNPFDMVIDASGAVWLTHASSILRLDAGARRFSRFSVWNYTVARMALDPDGRMWISTDHGSYPVTGPHGRGSPPALRHAYATDRPQIRGYTMFDREGNLWMATEYRGIQRVQRPNPRGAATKAEAAFAVERFTVQDGLTSNITERLMQDAEGNVWVGTEKGLDRFRRASVVDVPQLDDPHVFGDQLLVARDGSVFISEAGRIYRVPPGGKPEQILVASDRPSTICQAPDGDIWITLFRTVLVWRDGRVVGRKPTLPTDITVYDCAFDASGDYWISVARAGLYRLRGNRWERVFGQTSPDFRPRSMIADRNGRLVTQWSYRTLRYAEPSGHRAIRVPFQIQDPQPVTLYSPPKEVRVPYLYVGGPDGVARLVEGRWQRLGKDRVPGLVNVNGIVVTPGGEHWFAGSAGIVRIAASEAEAAFKNPDRRPEYERFDEDSGLASMPHDHSRRSIVQGGDGRIWIATQSGAAWIDPARLTRNPHPPKLRVSNVKVDNRYYRDPTSVRLNAGESDIEIDFSVLSLSNPEQTRARYMLEGQDDRWTSSGHRREAFYTNLAPGRYRFRVVAANEDGIENSDGASVDIEVVPTFVQSIWFLIALATATVLIIWLLLRLRAAQVAAQMRSRLEQRLMERETIARDLHDTLLQGVQGLMFRIQAVANRLTSGSQERQSLEQALERADDLVMQGRESVRNLRVSDMAGDLHRTLRDAVDDALLDDTIDVQIVERGSPRSIHPLALAEIKAIVGEALFNVGRHADATQVELVVSYGRRTLRLRVQDDGRGIPVDVLDSGCREGHFGLVGMRERAQVIGGSVVVRSVKEEGTEVVLDVPGGVAYGHGFRFGEWAARLWPRRTL
ncbi:signal transduction histidine kinase/ligand-binding sensor domain-containing protein [Novosphingobium gossypii]